MACYRWIAWFLKLTPRFDAAERDHITYLAVAFGVWLLGETLDWLNSSVAPIVSKLILPWSKLWGAVLWIGGCDIESPEPGKGENGLTGALGLFGLIVSYSITLVITAPPASHDQESEPPSRPLLMWTFTAISAMTLFAMFSMLRASNGAKLSAWCTTRVHAYERGTIVLTRVFLVCGLFVLGGVNLLGWSGNFPQDLGTDRKTVVRSSLKGPSRVTLDKTPKGKPIFGFQVEFDPNKEYGGATPSEFELIVVIREELLGKEWEFRTIKGFQGKKQLPLKANIAKFRTKSERGITEISYVIHDLNPKQTYKLHLQFAPLGRILSAAEVDKAMTRVSIGKLHLGHNFQVDTARLSK